MNKTKMKFMQEAPVFAFMLAGCTFGMLLIASVVMVAKGETFGWYIMCLICSAIAFLRYAFVRLSRGCDKPFLQIMHENKQYWKEHDK